MHVMSQPTYLLMFIFVCMCRVDVVMLALYNLHRTGQGLRGFYHWKSDIAAFIDTHWAVLHGTNRSAVVL